jgi:tetratricopeptide (TPR) repeat protein
VTAEDRELERVEALLELGRPDEAIPRVAALVAAAPDDSRRLALLAEALLDAGRPQESLTAAQRAVAADPGSSRAHSLACAALLDLERYGEAASAAREGLRLAPHEQAHLLNLAYALAGTAEAAAALGPRRRRLVREARAAAKEAVRLDPDSADAHATLGYVASVGGPRRAAVASYRRALQIDPHHALASSNLGAIRLNTYRLHQAGLQLSAALVSDPSLEVAHQNLAVLLRRGLVVVTAVSVVAVFPLVAGLEVEAQTGSRTWRTGVGAAFLGLLVLAWTALRRLPLSVRRYFSVVLRRRALHQVIALVAVASSASTLLVAVLPRRLATDLAHTHIGVAAYFVIGVLTVRLGSAALRGAHRCCRWAVAAVWRRLRHWST